MTDATRRFLGAVAADLASVTETTMEALLDAPSVPLREEQGEQHLKTLLNMLQQSPLLHDDRTRRIAELTALRSDLLVDPALVTVVDHIRSRPRRIPSAGAAEVGLPVLPPELTQVYLTLFDLDVTVAEPWTLIGGLMVLTHCAEHGVPFNRPTADADIAVSALTHRNALMAVTLRLARLGFRDVTPEPLGGGERPSYRYAAAQVHVDVVVPAKANAQANPAVTAAGRRGVELPATQQALRRTERVHVRTAEGVRGQVRRPDLLGSIIIKAAASTLDRRNPERHQEDLVTLSDTLAVAGSHPRYATQMSRRDNKRLREALAALPDRLWRRAQDPDAARAALQYLLKDAREVPQRPC